MSVSYDLTTSQVIKDILKDACKIKSQDNTIPNVPEKNTNKNKKNVNVINPVMLKHLDKMNKTTVNRSYRAIPAQGLRGKITKIIKRIMRRLTFWYVEPCMLQQTEYNKANSAFSAEVNSEINLLKLGHSDNLDKIEVLIGDADILRDSVADGFKDRDVLISRLSQRINNLDEQVTVLRNDTSIDDKIAHLEQLYQKNDELVNQKLLNIDQKFEQLEKRFEQNEKRFEQNEKRFEQNEKRFEQNEKRFEQNEKRFEQNEKRLEQYDKRFNEYIEFDRRRSEYEAEQRLHSSYSQSGEDSIIKYVFSYMSKRLDTVVYLDLGANHAKELSNTYYFYLNGGRGVLVEANPQLIDELKSERPRDIVLNNCIADKDDLLVDFYIFNGDGLSTSDYDSVQSVLAENKYLKLEKTVQVRTITIESIIKQYFRNNSPDVMNIDVEGMEMDILKAIDFSVFRPMMVICEMIEYKSALYIGEKRKEIMDFMQENGYVEYAFTGINSIFIDKKTYADSKNIYWGK